MILDATNQSITLTTGNTTQVDYVCSFVDHTTDAGVLGSSQGSVSSATNTTIISAPAASTQRQVKRLSCRNAGTVTQTVIIQKNVGGTLYKLTGLVSLRGGDTLTISNGGDVVVTDNNGAVRTAPAAGSGYGGYSTSAYKVGSVPEAAGVRYGWWKDSGFPGAWAPGTPGLNGRVTDGASVTDAGCLPWINPSVGKNYLTDLQATANQTGSVLLWDVLWVNSGAVVTTTTAQAITSPTFPARDLNGATEGLGVSLAIIVTTATTNGGGVLNMTASYTNSDGTAGRTATMASFPQTAVIGTVVPFQLAAGDRGVRSVQNITLGTSLVAGSVSLIAFREVAQVSCLLANAGQIQALGVENPGVALHNGSCLLPFWLPTGNNATNLSLVVNILEK